MVGICQKCMTVCEENSNKNVYYNDKGPAMLDVVHPEGKGKGMVKEVTSGC